MGINMAEWQFGSGCGRMEMSCNVGMSWETRLRTDPKGKWMGFCRRPGRMKYDELDVETVADNLSFLSWFSVLV